VHTMNDSKLEISCGDVVVGNLEACMQQDIGAPPEAHRDC
jgi:hypothetical protein